MMTFKQCSRERELAQTMRLGHWPAACADELRGHVAECRRCSDFVRVKTAMAAMRTRDAASARLEAPGLLLWRAQLRQRNAALERVARPMQQASVFGLVVLVAVLLGLGAMGLDANPDWWASTWQAGGRLVLLGMAGAIVLLGGVVAYLAAERE